MPDTQDNALENLSFSQRYGYKPLPEPMRLEHISDELRREIWNTLRQVLLQYRCSGYEGYYFSETGRRFVERIMGKLLGMPEDEIETDCEQTLDDFKRLSLNSPFNEFLDFVQIIVNDPIGSQSVNTLQKSFETYAAPYWLDTAKHPFHFFPRSTQEEGKAIQEAFQIIQHGGMEGAATHLRQATEHINAQQYGDSIADSIHAVESVARQIDPKASQTLSPALNSLAEIGLLKHPALTEAFKQLYGYTNDEQGIRHALLDKNVAAVGLDEAMFMFGACASFTAYLVKKHQREKNRDGDAA